MVDLVLKKVSGKTGVGFIPADQGSEIEIGKLPMGRRLRAKVTTPRSVKHNGLMFGPFFSTLAAILNDGPSDRTWDQNKVRKRLLSATGHADIYPAPKAIREQYGLPDDAPAFCIEPQSMSFDSMDQDAASLFYEEALAYVVREFGDWCRHHPLWPTIQGLTERQNA